MVHTENNKLIIQINAQMPDIMWVMILRGLSNIIQAAQRGENNEPTAEMQEALFYVMELYKAMLPSEEHTV